MTKLNRARKNITNQINFLISNLYSDLGRNKSELLDILKNYFEFLDLPVENLSGDENVPDRFFDFYCELFNEDLSEDFLVIKKHYKKKSGESITLGDIIKSMKITPDNLENYINKIIRKHRNSHICFWG